MPDLADLFNLSNITDPAVIANAIKLAREMGLSEEEVQQELRRLNQTRSAPTPTPPPSRPGPVTAAATAKPASPSSPRLPDLPQSVFAPPPPPLPSPPPRRELPALPDFPAESLFSSPPSPRGPLEERLSAPLSNGPIPLSNGPIPLSNSPIAPADPHEWTGTAAMDAPADLLTSLLSAGQGALGYLGSSLDKLGGRELRGLLGGNPKELLSAIPFSDTLGITDPRDIVSGRELYDRLGDRFGWNTRGDQGWGSSLAGMGMEAALDPLTLLGGLGLARKGLGFLGSSAREAGAGARLAELAPRSTAMSLSTLDPAMEATAGMGRAKFPISEHLPNLGPTQFKEIFGENPLGRLEAEGGLVNRPVDRSIVSELTPGHIPQGLTPEVLSPVGAPPPGGFPLVSNIPGMDPQLARQVSEDLARQLAYESGALGGIPPEAGLGEINPRNVLGPDRGQRGARTPIHESMPGFGTQSSRELFGRNPRIEAGVASNPSILPFPGVEEYKASELGQIGNILGQNPQIPLDPQYWRGQKAFGPHSVLTRPDFIPAPPGPAAPVLPPMLTQPPALPLRGSFGRARRDVFGNPIMESQARGTFQGRSGRSYNVGQPQGDELLDRLMNSGVPPELLLGTYAAGRAQRY